MKMIIAFITFLTLTLSASAQTLEAKPLAGLMKELADAKFTYVETGKIFGFNSTQSCLYVSEEVAVFKNYCFPVRKYPARGFTIISKKFGMIDLYEEQLTEVLLKRDITITQFPEILSPYLSTPLPQQTLKGLSSLIEKMHFNYFPACWSTSFSWYTETNDMNCSVPVANVVGALDWANETQSILLDETSWLELMMTVEKYLND